MALSQSPDTKTHLLDVAERLMANQGFDTVSLRQITTEAEMNLAAVNYHFGSREGLIEAVISMRIGPINEERLRLLDEAESGGMDTSLEMILDALIRPVVMVSRDRLKDREVFFRLMGRLIAECNERMSEVMSEQFREVLARFTVALSRAVPGVSMMKVHLHMLFSVGAMAHSLIYSDRMFQMSGVSEESPSLEELTRMLVAYAAAGFRSQIGGGDGE